MPAKLPESTLAKASAATEGRIVAAQLFGSRKHFNAL
jgi:hypothetical protein